MPTKSGMPMRLAGGAEKGGVDDRHADNIRGV
jgi:hypothetical protein